MSSPAPSPEGPSSDSSTLPDSVTVLRDGDREIALVGTAHVSQRSVEDVRHVIEQLKPDTVCVELDDVRYDALTNEKRWLELDLFKVIREGKVLYLLSTLGLAAYQRKIGERLGVRPGAELLEAVRAAEDVGAKLVLADRDIQVTLRRTWANLGFFSKMKLLGAMVAAPFSVQEITEEQIEALKDRDTISEMLDQLAEVMPQVKTPLIDERDQWLMSSIERAEGSRVVAIVGAGHVRGMLQQRGRTVDREALATLPPPSRFARVVKWVIPVLVLAAFAIGYARHEGEGLRHMLLAWILPNSVAAAVFTIAAGARALTVVTAFVASPITSLNPTIGAGMVAGLVEAWLRKPTVEDCQRIGEDTQSWRGYYRNPVTRVLLVVVLATLGSALGAWVGATWVVTLI